MIGAAVTQLFRFCEDLLAGRDRFPPQAFIINLCLRMDFGPLRKRL